MWVSGREACEMLREVGVGARAARRLLASGLAGEPIRTSAAHLFDADRVRAVAHWPTVPWHTIEAACPAPSRSVVLQAGGTSPSDRHGSALGPGAGTAGTWPGRS